ncbi:adenylate/guanylate cyclase domain-containing protein [Aestuariispira ectoiniformans]|uniref:adenylate/guanylate cyclase domain-containing protein n=1 Tax=Aestuariispira ectoiniformans TaxID=2775080 RepID=UPI00223B64D7|nr:adenylate/guanylate cyclase domain-containing protein [Aestuariispira ectoiniformans]
MASDRICAAADTVQKVSDDIIAQALAGVSPEELLATLVRNLQQAGFPLWRSLISCGWIHPMFQAQSFVWNSEDDIVVKEQHLHGSENLDGWLHSPIKAMIDESRYEARFNIGAGEGCNQFPVLADLRGQGGTDYLYMMAPFGHDDAALHRMDGIVSSWTTKQEGGFSDDEIDILRRLFPRLALGMKSLVREQTALNVLSAYLGTGAGQRVLEGQIQRGDGDYIDAVIWFCDMRDSTRLAEQLAPEEYLNLLNSYFEKTAGIVLDHGGEVLRFIGDAVLAIFPIAGFGGAERAARMALAAARNSISSMPIRQDGLPDVNFGLGLHVGEVLYGNIGVPERLEFSVIGRAANETARLEDLTKELGINMLVSQDFVDISPVSPWKSLGTQALTGVSQPISVYTLAD